MNIQGLMDSKGMASSSSVVKRGSVPMNNVSVTPEATYDDVVADSNLFMSSLKNLHSLLGTKFIVPIIGGGPLDLHKLFVEVTSRGGIDKVINERKWKDVIATFVFPITATNASFLLRKYYSSLLYNYEQIYYFRTTGSAAGSNVIGVIDGKFQNGYLVTVTIGSEQLRGVLYQLLPQNTVAYQTPQQGHGVLPNTGNNFANPLGVTGGVRKRRRRRRNPAHPKPNRSGYTFFFAEQHARLKPLHPGKDREITRIIGELWSKLNEEEKSVYQGKAMEDKERYRTEMEDYREKLRTGQRLPEQNVDMAEADLPLEEGEEDDEEGGFSGEIEIYDDDQSGETDAELEETSLHPSLLNPNPNLTEMVMASNEKTGDVVMETSVMNKADEQTRAMVPEQN